MKTLVIIALFISANFGTTLFANPIEKPTAPHADAFKSQVAYHQRNVSTLWQQYDLRVQQIRNRTGSHADLERDEAYFVNVYQKDIDNNIRVAESKKIISEIQARYAQARAQRSAEEARRITVLQTQLKKALKREAKALSKTKRTYADLANSLPLFSEVESYANTSIERVDLMLADSQKTLIAAR